MIYEYMLNGLPLKTGDLICTTDGGGNLLAGEFWRLVGKLIPGDVDHIAVYVGPSGRCVESGATGRVIQFDISGDRWDAEAMYNQRKLIDTLYGIAYPLDGIHYSDTEEREIREEVREYCLAQAEARKSYNLNFLNPATEDGFYCSQLAYKAYLPCGIDLNTGVGVPDIPGTSSIVFPQEIWSGCSHLRP